MDRAELERLGRDALIQRAEEAGVARPNILTRPELVDELLLRGAASSEDEAARRSDPRLRKLRGFFGIARDLLASVIDRGLHLPDAAERIRSIGSTAPESGASRRPPAVLPTVTLAEIYAAQGHRARAVETLERVLEREPEHGAAQSLLQQLRDASFTVPEPTLPPETEEDPARADAGVPDPAPQAHGDACVAIPAGDVVFVTWELSEHALSRARRVGGNGSARLVLALVFAMPSWEGPRTSTREVEVELAGKGQWSGGIPAGAVTRVAVGVRAAGVFVPLALAPALEAAGPEGGAPTRIVRWTPEGLVSLAPTDIDAGPIARALAHPEVAARLVASTDPPRFATKPS